MEPRSGNDPSRDRSCLHADDPGIRRRLHHRGLEQVQQELRRGNANSHGDGQRMESDVTRGARAAEKPGVQHAALRAHLAMTIRTPIPPGRSASRPDGRCASGASATTAWEER